MSQVPNVQGIFEEALIWAKNQSINLTGLSTDTIVDFLKLYARHKEQLQDRSSMLDIDKFLTNRPDLVVEQLYKIEGLIKEVIINTNGEVVVVSYIDGAFIKTVTGKIDNRTNNGFREGENVEQTMVISSKNPIDYAYRCHIELDAKNLPPSYPTIYPQELKEIITKWGDSEVLEQLTAFAEKINTFLDILLQIKKRFTQRKSEKPPKQ